MMIDCKVSMDSHVYIAVEGAENVRRSLSDWLCFMQLSPAGQNAELRAQRQSAQACKATKDATPRHLLLFPRHSDRSSVVAGLNQKTD